MREGELTHVRQVLHEIVGAVAECGGQDSEEGEEHGWPGRDVGEEKVVNMDPSLCSKRYGHKEYQCQHYKGHYGLQLDKAWPDTSEAAGYDFQIAKEGGNTDSSQEKKVETSEQPK